METATISAAPAQTLPRARRLLIAGAAAGPLFYAVVIAQAAARSGFSITRHPLSLLSVGKGGWIQAINFVVAGALALAGSAGLRILAKQGVGSQLAATLIGAFGAGTVIAGLFAPDAAFGFPPGAIAGSPEHMSLHSMLHGAAFDGAFLCLIAATFVTARNYARDSRRAWIVYCNATGVTLPMLVVAGMALPPVMGIVFFVAGATAFAWLSAICWDRLPNFQ